MEPTTFPIFYLVDTILILYSQTTMAVDLKVQKLFLQLFTDGSCLITLFGKGGGVIFISLYFKKVGGAKTLFYFAANFSRSSRD